MQLQEIFASAVKRAKLASQPPPSAAVCESDHPGNHRFHMHDNPLALEGPNDDAPEVTSSSSVSSEYSDISSRRTDTEESAAEYLVAASQPGLPPGLGALDAQRGLPGSAASPGHAAEQRTGPGDRSSANEVAVIEAESLEGSISSDRLLPATGVWNRGHSPESRHPVWKAVVPAGAAVPGAVQGLGGAGDAWSPGAQAAAVGNRANRLLKSPELVAAFVGAARKVQRIVHADDGWRTSARAARSSAQGLDGAMCSSTMHTTSHATPSSRHPLHPQSPQLPTAYDGGAQAVGQEGEPRRSRADTLQGAALLQLPRLLVAPSHGMLQLHCTGEGLPAPTQLPRRKLVPVAADPLSRLPPLMQPQAGVSDPYDASPQEPWARQRHLGTAQGVASGGSQPRSALLMLPMLSRCRDQGGESFGFRGAGESEPGWEFGGACMPQEGLPGPRLRTAGSDCGQAAAHNAPRWSVRWQIEAAEQQDGTPCSGDGQGMHDPGTHAADGDRAGGAGPHMSMLSLLLQSRLKSRFRSARHRAAFRAMRSLEDKVRTRLVGMPAARGVPIPTVSTATSSRSVLLPSRWPTNCKTMNTRC